MPEAGAWMPMYWADYLGDTMHLSTEEHGAYLLLIATYWRRGGPLPDDDHYLANVVKMTRRRFKFARDKLTPFFDIHEGAWHHKRVEHEILKSSKRQAAARASGVAGGLAKAKRTGKLLTYTESESKRTIEPSTETPCGVSQPDLDALFYKRGKALLGQKAGGQLTKLRAACGSVGVALEIIDKAKHKDSPAEYVAGCIRNKGNGHAKRSRNQRASVVEAVQWLDERREADSTRTRDDAAEGEVRKLERR